MSDHHHSHAHANQKVLRVSLCIIAGFMLVEIVGGWLTNSLALLSDAGHMFSDALALGLSLLAFSWGSRPADQRKTWGYRRFEVLAAALNSTTLIVIAAMVAAEAVIRLVQPPKIATTGMLVVAVIGLIANIVVAVYMLKHGDNDHNLNMRGAYLHVLGDLLGSIAAIAAAVCMRQFGWWWADPLAGLAVALLIARSGWQLGKNVLHILMEGVPHHINLTTLSDEIRGISGVSEVFDLRVWSITEDDTALSCRLLIAAEYDRTQTEQITAAVEHLLRQHHINHTTIQIYTQRPESGCLNTHKNHKAPQTALTANTAFRQPEP